MTSSDEETTKEFPARMFAAGEEPVGMRVNAYNCRWRLDDILETLDESELNRLKETFLGRFIEKMDKPGYSGRFGHFLLTRQLEVKKKNEAWFLFAGNPIRFSLREFEIVTALPCGPYPPAVKKRKRCKAGDKPYWGELFGRAESVYVDHVTSMLQRKDPVDPELRFKYACLAILDGFIMPTNHQPKISKEHAELIADLGEFLAYPWGRAAFSMTMASIKKRDPVSIDQSTVAINGFFYALQLVMGEAVPALYELPAKPGVKYSESEDDEPCTVKKRKKSSTDSSGKLAFNAMNARDIDDMTEVVVDSILADEGDLAVDDGDMGWDDNGTDEKIDHIVKLIGKDFDFTKEMFKGGCTKADIARMKIEKEKEKAADAKKKRRTRKRASLGDSPQPVTISDQDIEKLATLVGTKLSLTLMGTDLVGFEDRITSSFAQTVGKLEKLVINAVNQTRTDHRTAPTTRRDNPPAAANRAPNQNVYVPSSAHSDCNHDGVANDGERRKQRQDGAEDLEGSEEDAIDDGINATSEQVTNQGRGVKPRKSQRTKIPSTKIGEDFECAALRKNTSSVKYGGFNVPQLEKKFSALSDHIKKGFTANGVDGLSVGSKDIANLVERTKYMSNKMVDTLMKVLPNCLTAASDTALHVGNAVFLDTKFVSTLVKLYANCKKTKPDESFEFMSDIINQFTSCGGLIADHIFMPFNLDKRHWVGVCVCKQEQKLLLFDCNHSFRTEAQVKKDVLPIAEMIPLLISKAESSSRICQPFVIERVSGVVQNKRNLDSGVMTFMMLHAYCVGGLEGCKSIAEGSLISEAQKLGVLSFEYLVESLPV